MPNAKEKLMQAVADLILERGYGGTSVEAACEQAGVSKGSFFHHFESKQDAACATLDFWIDGLQQRLKQAGVLDQATPQETLHAYLEFLASRLEQPDGPAGCLLGSLALEVSQTHPDVQQKTADYFDKWAKQVASMIQAALGDTEPQRSIRLANHLIASLEGALLMAKTSGNPSLLRSSIELVGQQIQSAANQSQ